MKELKGLAVLFLVAGCLLVSCKGSPAENQIAPDRVPTQAPGIQPSAPVFDPASISQAEKDTAMQEIRQLTQRLNTIIRAKNYDAWVPYLAPQYFAYINSPEFLETVSKSAVLVKQNIVLNSARDYFIHVVVPSRANSRVDNIEFISPNHVKAYTDTRDNRLRLFDLEKTNDGWKIIN